MQFKILEILDKPFANCIQENLFLGSIDELIDNVKYDAIVSVITPNAYTAEEIIELTPATKHHLYISLQDSYDANFAPHWDAIYDFIDRHLKRKEKVFVHCMRGRSRSATAVIYYVMRSRNISLSDAVTIVKKKRSCIRPNDNFVNQLISMEKTVLL